MENQIGRTLELANSSYVVSRASATSRAWRFLNLAYLEKVAPGNKKFFADIMMVFRTDSVHHLTIMKQQFDSRDFAGLSKTAHTLKPTGVYVGADVLTGLMAKLEKVALAGDENHIALMITEAQNIVLVLNAEIDEYLKAA